MRKVLVALIATGLVFYVFADTREVTATTEQYINVQRGFTYFTSADGTTKDVELTNAVDRDHAFIHISIKGEGTIGAQDMDEIFMTAEFVDDDTIRFQRQDSTNNAEVSWQVIEANPDAPTPAFEVQTGELAFGSGDTSNTTSITDITSTTSAMILTQGRFTAASDIRTQILFTGEFDDTDTIRLTRGASGTAATVRYWVIKWSADFSVQANTISIGSGDSGTTSDTISSVTTSRTMLFFTYNSDQNGLSQTSVKGYLSSATGVTFERTDTGTTINEIVYTVVEFPSGVTGQSNSTDWADTSNSNTSTLTSVDLDATLIFHSAEVTGTGTAFPRGVTTIYIDSATQLTMAVSYSGQTTTVAWTLVDTSGWTFTNTENTPPDATWMDPAWNSRIKLTIDRVQVAGEHADFPVYVDLSDMPSAFFSGINSDGGDIRVTGADGLTEVPREIVFASTTAETGELHFKADISHNIDNVFYIYYDNDSASDYAADHTYGSENVWSDYIGVWHLEEDPGGSAPQTLDSTSNDHDGTSQQGLGSSGQVDGKLAGYGVDFDGTNDFIEVDHTAALEITGDLTITFWYNKDTNSGADKAISKGPAFGTVSPYGVRSPSSGGMILDHNDGTGGSQESLTTTNTFSLDAWHYVAVIRESGVRSIFVDDNAQEAGPELQSRTPTASGDPLTIGTADAVDPTDSPFDGTLDEMRIRNTAIHPTWARTEYNNQNSPNTFYSVSNESLPAEAQSGTLKIQTGTVKIENGGIVID